MENIIRIGTRDSKLALLQAELVQKAIQENGCQAELVPMKTKGDRILDRKLSEIGGKGLFVAELEDALRAGQVDLLVHSMKDLPMQLADGFPIVAASKREDPRDVLVFPKTHYKLDRNKPFGSSSNRRIAALRRLFPDCSCKPVRGNLQTRLRKLDSPEPGEEYAALVLAAAGLKRLGLADRIGRYFSVEEMLPAAGQGILAVQAAEDFDRKILAGFADETALLCGSIEREFVRLLCGDCASPIGAYCVLEGETLTLTGFNGVYSLSESAALADSGALAERLAQKFAAQGQAILVGAGPGNPDYLTIAGQKALQRCDVVLYDSLSDKGLLALAPKAEQVYVGKRAGQHSASQEEINRILCGYVGRGLQVVRLKGGDPFVFGRGGEELLALRERGLAARVIPGVTSAIAAAECGFIPVTHRGMARSFHVITAHEKGGIIRPEEVKKYAIGGGTLVFLMGLSAAGAIKEGLLLGGMSPQTPAAILENGTLPQQRTICTTLADLPEEILRQQVESPAIILVGEVVTLREQILPERQAKVVVTREAGKVSELEQLLRDAGMTPYRYPCIRTEVLPCPADFAKRLEDSEVLVFSSDAGVDGFFGWLADQKIDLRRLVGKQFAAVGAKTAAALAKRGIYAEVVPAKAGGKWLAQEMAMMVPKDAEIWLLQAEAAHPALESRLLEDGFSRIRKIAVYKTVGVSSESVALRKAAAAGELLALTFTSGSCVAGFIESFGGMVPAELLAIPAICIGPTAYQAALRGGFTAVQSPEATLASLVAEAATFVS